MKQIEPNDLLKWVTRGYNGVTDLVETWISKFGKLPADQYMYLEAIQARLGRILGNTPVLKPGIRAVTNTIYLKPDGQIATKEEAYVSE